MDIRSFFGLAPAWTRWAAHGIACIGMVTACSIGQPPASHEPACQTSTAGSYPTPSAHWTFDQAPMTDGWPSDDGRYNLIPGCSDCDGDIAVSDSTVRLNGDIDGRSILLDGNHYLMGSTPVNSEGTISAWISISQKEKLNADGAEWPIISTLSDSCSGYELAIRFNSKEGAQLIFKDYHGDQDAGTKLVASPREIGAAVSSPSWAWRTGRWHHVAATYSYTADTTSVQLYWDGKLILNDTSSGVIATPIQSLPTFVGTNQTYTPKFLGHIDELALFDTPLGETDLRDFVQATTTRRGPSGCRWRTTEARDDGVGGGLETKATWADIISDTEATATIVDEEWGGAEVSAMLAPEGLGKDLTGFSTIILRADIPDDDDDETPNGSFEFALYSGDDYCIWYLKRSGTGIYEIPLAYPDFCQTNPAISCRFPLDKVEWASIRSSWEYPQSRKNTNIAYTIRGLDLAKDGDLPAWSSYGGMRGPNGWCWRPQAFQVQFRGHAYWDFDGDMASSGTITAKLSGSGYSSSRLVADFGDGTIDLSKCREIKLDGTIPEKCTLHLQDELGSWKDCAIGVPAGQEYSAVIIADCQTALSNQKKADQMFTCADETNCFYPWSNFGEIKLGQIALLGIQMPWIDAEGAPIWTEDVVINNVTLFDKDGGVIE